MNSSRWATLIVVVVLILWMLSGLFKRSDSNADDSGPAASNNLPMAVLVQASDNVLMTREIELQGQLEPKRQLTVKAQTSGVVGQILASKGQTINEGAALVQLELGSRGNALAEAEALVKTAKSEQAAASTLRQQRLQSQLQLEQAEAALEAALARLGSITLDIDNTTVTAPFTGIINDIPVERGTLIERGDPVAELIDTSTFMVSASASQTSLAELFIGQPLTTTLITGQTLTGELTYISAIADAQSRTFAIEAIVDNPTNSIAAGVSASIHIPVEQLEATFVSPSALSLNAAGLLGVKVVDDADVVEFVPVELISTTLDGAWVSGIDPGIRIITLGQGFVNPGDKVQPQLQEGN